jgi:hypothetical protein
MRSFAAVLFFFLFFVFRSASEKTKNSLNGKYHAAAGKTAFELAPRKS